MREQWIQEEFDNPEYREFVEKFKPKKTTDDCYTPENVYNTVRDFAVKEYGLDGREILRPFWPGADYRKVEYPAGCVVIDNPPFSIASKICRFYDDLGVDYFLFAPGLTLFNINNGIDKYVVTGTDIIFQNGAEVYVGFVTSLGSWKINLAPELAEELKKCNNKNNTKKTLPKYSFPDCVASAAHLGKIVTRGIGLKIPEDECKFTKVLDAMKDMKKSGIFGGGFILSEAAAAERAAAERAAEERAAEERAAEVEKNVFELSEREKAIQKSLGRKESEC